MSYRVAELLRFVLENIAFIREEVNETSLAEYLSDRRRRDLVETYFIRIGEDLKQLSRFSATTEEQISSVRAILDFRNVLVHEYRQVDDLTVWAIAEESLPKLEAEILAWLESLDERA